MWKYLLSAKQLFGYRFRRERPILNYIADFVSFELMLIVEVDCITHESEAAQRRDKLRDKELNQIGFTVKRYGSWEVLNKMVDVSEDLTTWIIKHQKSSLETK
jgi:very-short-patch-repair endonuclease